jgi:probable phosphoglycerate mutase
LLVTRLRSDPNLAGLDVLAFAHGHVLRVLMARWLGFHAEAARHFTLASGAIAALDWEHEWPVLAGWNQ